MFFKHAHFLAAGCIKRIAMKLLWDAKKRSLTHSACLGVQGQMCIFLEPLSPQIINQLAVNLQSHLQISPDFAWLCL